MTHLARLKFQELHRQLFLTVTLVLAACAPGTQQGPSGEEFQAVPVERSGAKVDIDLATLVAEQPDAIDSSATDPQTLQAAGINWTLREGTRLIAVKEANCQPVSAVGEGDVQVLWSQGAKSSDRVESIILDQGLSLSELNTWAERQDCLQLITNDHFLQVQDVPNDPEYSRQLFHTALESTQAWSRAPLKSGSPQPVIAVVDTGIDYRHDDLKGVLWKNASGKFGHDFHNNDTDPLDDHSHGTHVAGLAAAAYNNGRGGSGVAGGRARIMALKISDASGRSYASNVINAIYYAIENGAKVINISMAGYGKSSAWDAAFREGVQKGVTFTIAAGNDAVELTSSRWVSPASYGRSYAGVITVGAYDSGTLGRSGFSNFSTDYVEISAPGSNGMLSTYPNQAYRTKNGTSMAAPVVAGAVAFTQSVLMERGYAPLSPAAMESFILEASPYQYKLKPYVKDGKQLQMRALAERIDQKWPARTAPTPTPKPTPTPAPTPKPTPVPTPTPPPSQSEDYSFTLVDSVRDRDLRNLNAGGDTIGLNEADSFNVRVNAPANANAVAFHINGRLTRMERARPFALAGMIGSSDYRDWRPSIGVYEIKAIVYEEKNGQWLTLATPTIRLSVVAQAGGGGTAPLPDPGSIEMPKECGRMTQAQCRLFGLVSAYRMAQGLAPLALNDRCIMNAQFHANNMATYNFLSHDGPVATTQASRHRLFGLDTGGTNELLAAAGTPEDALDSWVKRTSDRAQMMDAKVVSGGVGESGGRWVLCLTAQR